MKCWSTYVYIYIYILYIYIYIINIYIYIYIYTEINASSGSVMDSERAATRKRSFVLSLRERD